MLVKERCSDEISTTGEPIINKDVMGELPLDLYKKYWLDSQTPMARINGEKTEFFYQKNQIAKSQMPCPSRQELIDYIFDKFPKETDVLIKSHLGVCKKCQKNLLFGKKE